MTASIQLLLPILPNMHVYYRLTSGHIWKTIFCIAATSAGVLSQTATRVMSISICGTSPTSFFFWVDRPAKDAPASCYGPLSCDLDAITFCMHSG